MTVAVVPVDARRRSAGLVAGLRRGDLNPYRRLRVGTLLAACERPALQSAHAMTLVAAMAGTIRNDGLLHIRRLSRSLDRRFAAALAATTPLAFARGITCALRIGNSDLGAFGRTGIAGPGTRVRLGSRRMGCAVLLALAAARPFRSRFTRAVPPGNGRPLAAVGVFHVAAYRAAQSHQAAAGALSIFVGATLPALPAFAKFFL